MNELQIGTISLQKGYIREGHPLIAWDAIQTCQGKDCKIFHLCKSVDKKNKCAVQVEYLQSLIASIRTTYKYLDDVQLFQIGMHLIPLYSHLVRLKIIEMGLTEIASDSKKGKFIHPVYKEIRQTMQIIMITWKSIGCGTPEMGGDLNPGGVNPTDPRMQKGDPTYYDGLVAQEKRKPLKKKGVVIR